VVSEIETYEVVIATFFSGGVSRRIGCLAGAKIATLITSAASVPTVSQHFSNFNSYKTRH